MASIKGGVGKTTTTANLGAALTLMGRKVLLIDFDPQGNLSQGLGHRSSKPTVFEVLRGTPFIDAIVEKNGFFLVPANVSLADAEIEMGSRPAREMCLKRALKKFTSEKFDYILIDCPPTAGFFPLNALTASDHLLIPVETQYYPLEGLQTMEKFRQMVCEYVAPELKLLGILPTKYDSRRSLDREALEMLKKRYPGQVTETVIRTNTALAEAPAHGQTIFEWAPDSKGAQDYKALAREIEERISQ